VPLSTYAEIAEPVVRRHWPPSGQHEPDPDPFTPVERDAILEWFRTKTFGRVGRPSQARDVLTPKRVHPPFHVYLHTLFWTGMRPSEAAGLRWTDMDLDQRQGRVQGSRHSYFRSRRTKTKAARRTVQFTSETTALLKSIMPLHVEPDTPVFTNVDGEPIEPKVFSTHGTTAYARSASGRAGCTAPRTRSARSPSRAA